MQNATVSAIKPFTAGLSKRGIRIGKKHLVWRSKLLDVPSAKEFREIEVENNKLKNILGEKDLEIAILRDLLKKTNPALDCTVNAPNGHNPKT